MQSTDVQMTVLFYGDSALLITNIIRGMNGRVIDGTVINGAWRFKDHIGDNVYDYEKLVPIGMKGDYNTIISWALNNRVARPQTLLDGGQ